MWGDMMDKAVVIDGEATLGLKANGEISLRNNIDGSTDTIAVIDGESSLDFDIDGNALLDLKIDGEISIDNHIDGEQGMFYRYVVNGGESEIYHGEYTFTPTQSTQIVHIEGKTASKNITINPIPSNYGLITWNGLSLTVS